MMHRAEDRTAAALDRLLAAERQALLTGRLAGLDRVAQAKLALVTRLAAAPDGADALARMRAALARQDSIIAAARDGALSARKAEVSLSTYGPDGATDPAQPVGSRVARRV
jgi:flagellar biosynthesis/type III secretory pathway chaperone